MKTLIYGAFLLLGFWALMIGLEGVTLDDARMLAAFVFEAVGL